MRVQRTTTNGDNPRGAKRQEQRSGELGSRGISRNAADDYPRINRNALYLCAEHAGTD